MPRDHPPHVGGISAEDRPTMRNNAKEKCSQPILSRVFFYLHLFLFSSSAEHRFRSLDFPNDCIIVYLSTNYFSYS